MKKLVVATAIALALSSNCAAQAKPSKAYKAYLPVYWTVAVVTTIWGGPPALIGHLNQHVKDTLEGETTNDTVEKNGNQ